MLRSQSPAVVQNCSLFVKLALLDVLSRDPTMWDGTSVSQDILGLVKAIFPR